MAAVRIRILTYNVHKAVGVDRRFAPERIAEVIRHHNPDVVLLQEVDRRPPRIGAPDLASHLCLLLDYPYRACSMNVFRRTWQYGNATFSRFPMGRARNIDLTIAWRKRRGAQHTRLHVPVDGRDVTLDVFNVHLGLSAGERYKQMQRLLATRDITELSPAHACVIAGDTNDWRGLLGRPLMLPAGFACATMNGNGSTRSLRTFPSYAPAGGLDKIFYRGELRHLETHVSRLRVARVASDHLPVMSDFELRVHQGAGAQAAAS